MRRQRGNIARLIVLLACFLAVGAGAGFAAFELWGDGDGSPRPAHTRPAKRTVPERHTAPRTVERAMFDTGQAMETVRFLSEQIGSREEGSAGEESAASYLADRLKEYGYHPTVTPVPIGGTGETTRNVFAVLPGRSVPGGAIVIGAHIDTKNGPGANDNATGCGVVLELARVMRVNRLAAPSVVFAFFGGEEVYDASTDKNLHHWGSRYFAANLASEVEGEVVGMISVDMVGGGTTFNARNMGTAPRTLLDQMMEYSKARGSGLSYLADTYRYGSSDHEPFESIGIPSVWLEYKDPPSYHTPGDAYGTVNSDNVGNTGGTVQGFIEDYEDAARVAALRRQ